MLCFLQGSSFITLNSREGRALQEFMISSFNCGIGIRRFTYSSSKLKTMQTDSTKGSTENTDQTGSSKKWPQWAQALRNVAVHPEKYKDKVLQSTDKAVVFPDLYPKGKKHVLVISRWDGLDRLAEVGKEHLPLLQHMHKLGEDWITYFLNKDPSLIFRLGYHSVPSMRQLHLHVISQDFDSPCLKNAKHWNSFTSSFFGDSKKVLTELESHGKVTTCSKEEETRLLNSPLSCHRCRSIQKDITHLKDHIRKCTVPFPSELIPYTYSSSFSA